MFCNTLHALLIYSSSSIACDETIGKQKVIHIWQIALRLKQHICIELTNWGYVEHL